MTLRTPLPGKHLTGYHFWCDCWHPRIKRAKAISMTDMPGTEHSRITSPAATQ